MILIGLSAKAGAGKTTVANLLLQRTPGAVRMAFADVLKHEVAQAFGFPLEWCYSEEGKGRQVDVPLQCLIDHPGLTDALLSCGKPGPLTVREAMQLYGTNYRRSQDPEYWVKAFRADLAASSAPAVLVDDVRFPNEADTIRDLGGMLVRIETYPGWQPGPFAGHASETALDDWSEWDMVCSPGCGEAEKVADSIRLAMDAWPDHRRAGGVMLGYLFGHCMPEWDLFIP